MCIRDRPNSDSYRESNTFIAGTKPVVVDTPFIKLGLAVCYDLRFPELFRSMVNDGVQMVALPAAFTKTTGRAHWEILLRARAIENQIWMLGAGQCGSHANNKQTYGNSMIVDPWGQIMQKAETNGNSVCVVDIKSDEQTQIRQTFPCLKHRVL